MNWHRVASFPLERDLGQLNHWLKSQGFAHRISIEGDSQVLWTTRAELIEPLQSVAEHFAAGQPLPEQIRLAVPHHSYAAPSGQRVPVTLIFILLGFTGSALFAFGSEWIGLFTFYDLTPFFRSRHAFYDVLAGDYWRLITPIFLHFGFLHIAFNAMWLWYLGSRLEQLFGSRHLLLLILLIGLGSNIAQALVSYPIPFGGLSGVVFGLLGYFWLTGRLQPDPLLYMPPSLFPIMMVLMLISVFGAFDWMADAEVADTAHISGLLFGLILALADFFLRRGRTE